MFVSVKFNNWFSSDPKSPDYWRFNYTLVDDEFGEVSGAGMSRARAWAIAGAGGCHHH